MPAHSGARRTRCQGHRRKGRWHDRAPRARVMPRRPWVKGPGPRCPNPCRGTIGPPSAADIRRRDGARASRRASGGREDTSGAARFLGPEDRAGHPFAGSGAGSRTAATGLHTSGSRSAFQQIIHAVQVAKNGLAGRSEMECTDPAPSKAGQCQRRTLVLEEQDQPRVPSTGWAPGPEWQACGAWWSSKFRLPLPGQASPPARKWTPSISYPDRLAPRREQPLFRAPMMGGWLRASGPRCEAGDRHQGGRHELVRPSSRESDPERSMCVVVAGL